MIKRKGIHYITALMDDPFKARIQQIFGDLDRYNYYELLNLAPGAPPDDIRTAFHGMASSLHPDKFAQNPDEELREQIYAIYKRITEGYRVLMDHEDRKEYTAGLAQGKVRLNRTERKVTGPKRVDADIKNPQAKKFFNMAKDAERRGDLKNAKVNFKFALDMEGEHEMIKSHMEQVEARLAEKEEANRPAKKSDPLGRR